MKIKYEETLNINYKTKKCSYFYRSQVLQDAKTNFKFSCGSVISVLSRDWASEFKNKRHYKLKRPFLCVEISYRIREKQADFSSFLSRVDHDKIKYLSGKVNLKFVGNGRTFKIITCESEMLRVLILILFLSKYHWCFLFSIL